MLTNETTKEMLMLLAKLSQKMKNDIWAARRPNHYEFLFQIPQEASFDFLRESQRMFAIAALASICY